MRIHPVSFVLGLGAAALVPLFTRVLRPVAVELAAAGLVVYEEGRRVLARQMETLADIGAEARARSAVMGAHDRNGHVDVEADAASVEADAETEAAGDEPPADEPPADEPPSDGPAPRRPTGASRRRAP